MNKFRTPSGLDEIGYASPFASSFLVAIISLRFVAEALVLLKFK